jgi:hypothetical protein
VLLEMAPCCRTAARRSYRRRFGSAWSVPNAGQSGADQKEQVYFSENGSTNAALGGTPACTSLVCKGRQGYAGVTPAQGETSKKTVRNNGLSLFFGLIFILDRRRSGTDRPCPVQRGTGRLWSGRNSLGEYLTSSNFAVDVSENWRSEYLQFLLYIFATIWLVQKGSPESKEPDKTWLETD